MLPSPRTLVIALIFLLTSGCTLAQSDLPTGRVVGVKDGDTVVLLIHKREVTVRLQGVDCPEKKQAFGERAKQFTSDFCFGKTVSLDSTGVDRYGRVLGAIILDDGRNLNVELVRAGMAWWYKRYSKDETLERLENEARAKRIGLWSDPAPIAPWDFRRGVRPGS